jgi:hypothetical protein
MKVSTIAIFTFINLLLGCKPGTESNVQSLENFAANKILHRNECRAPKAFLPKRLPDAKKIPVMFIGKTAKARTSELKSVVQQTLTALPIQVLKMFETAGGEIVIEDNAVKNCTEISRKSGLVPSNVDVESCHLYTTNKKTLQPHIAIMISPDEAIIKHDLVKAVGLAISHRISKFSLSDSKPGFQVNKTTNPSIGSFQDRLARAFLLDVVSQQRNSLYQSVAQRYFSVPDPEALSALVDESNISDLVDGRVNFMKHMKFHDNGSYRAMMGWVFAHAIDSAYCNSFAPYNKEKAAKAIFANDGIESQSQTDLHNTVKVMRDFFPITYNTFKSNEPRLLDFAKWIANSFPRTNSDSSGLSLQAATDANSLLGRYKKVPEAYKRQHAQEHGYDYDSVKNGAHSVDTYTNKWGYGKSLYPYEWDYSYRDTDKKQPSAENRRKTEENFRRYAREAARDYEQSQVKIRESKELEVQKLKEGIAKHNDTVRKWATDPRAMNESYKKGSMDRNSEVSRVKVQENQFQSGSDTQSKTGIEIGGGVRKDMNVQVEGNPASGVGKIAASSNQEANITGSYSDTKVVKDQNSQSASTKERSSSTYQGAGENVQSAAVDGINQQRAAYEAAYPQLYTTAKDLQRRVPGAHVEIPVAPAGWTQPDPNQMAVPPQPAAQPAQQPMAAQPAAQPESQLSHVELGGAVVAPTQPTNVATQPIGAPPAPGMGS